MGCSAQGVPGAGAVILDTQGQRKRPLLQDQGYEKLSDAHGDGVGLPVRPPGHSRGLGTRVLVAAPADGLGPLPVVAQVPLDHVVVAPAPAAIFGELDPWREDGLTWAWYHQAPAAPPGPVPRYPSCPSHSLKKPSLISPSHVSLV